MSSGGGESDPISSLAQNCWESWAGILAQSGHTYGSRGFVQEYQRRYEAWIVFLGVFANGNLSLDHRLRNSFEIKTSKLFEKMQQNHLIQGDGVKITPTLEAVFCGVEDTLNRLHRLGVAIRDASAGQLMSRIKPLSKDLRVSSFEKLTYSIIANLYRSANPRLLEHVSASLALKYQIIIYRQGREKKYHALPGQHDVQNPPPPTAHAYRQERKAELKAASRPQAGKQETTAGQVQSSTISSTFDEQAFKQQLQQTHKAPGLLPPSVTTVHMGSANCPPQPIIPDDAKYAKCEWCLESLPASLFKTQPEWRKHVKRDWNPYICISEDCANLTPVPSFAKASEWERHMQAQHGDDWPRTVYKQPTWICDLEHPGMDGVETPCFTTDAGLVTHIQESHEGISSDEIQTMVRYNTVLLSRAADVCLFCGYTVEDDPERENVAAGSSGDELTASQSATSRRIHTIPEESEDNSLISRASKRMYCHVAEHLNNFTVLMIRMISIPDGSDDTDSDESIVFTQSSSVGDNKSNYQNWESSSSEADDAEGEESVVLTQSGSADDNRNWESSSSEAEDEHLEHQIPYSNPIVQKLNSDATIGTGAKRTTDGDYVSETNRNILPAYYIPLRRNANFVGRKDVLDTLKKMLFGDKSSQRVVLVGPEGVGKTQVALEVAYWTKDHQPDYSILWIPTPSMRTINQAYTEIAKQLSIQIDHKQGLIESLRRHLNSKNAGKFLLIVDDANNPDILLGSENSRALYDYLPKSEDSLILFATRSRNIATGLPGSDVIDLHNMSKLEATELLYETLINKELLHDKTGTEMLLRELHALWISKDDQNTERFNLFYYVGLFLHAERRFRDAIVALEQTYRFRKQFLSEYDDSRLASERALGKAYLENRRIKEAIVLFQHIVDVLDSRERTSQSIGAQSTAECELAQAYYEDRQTERCIEILERSLFGEKHPLTEINERSEPEILLASAYIDSKRPKKAIDILERVVSVQKKTLAEEDRVRLKTESVLASAYIDEGRITEAVRILENAQTIWDKTTAADDHDRLTSKELLAYAYLDSGQTSQATFILQNVVSIREKTLKADDTERLTSEHELSYAYIKIGRFQDAINILQKVVLIEEQLDMRESQRIVSRDLLAEAKWRGWQERRSGKD
ncbi:hypothetical protein NPX13_g3623 [Xylaria arbuscula]|uniref:AAA+ ATPase domain-containing protein n=1 Tax=Xylaria arbuscula TaxID=114810 RepID=A0A9W8NGZ5_9PEZI|nr:hypothetical protein NPX13_g3623 [Xylaria arbuscula]